MGGRATGIVAAGFACVAPGLRPVLVGLYDSVTVERIVFNDGLTAIYVAKILVAP
jgi:hypothetical protein